MLKAINRDYTWILLVLLIIAELVINPVGEFPLNDDWAFSKVISTYINSGVFRFSDWQSLPLAPQLFSGIVLAKLFGFSFTILRFISIASLFLLILVSNSILKELNILSTYRFIVLFCLAFNPLTLSLSNTFLPDVFTLLLTLFAFLFMLKIFKLFNGLHFALLILFSTLATLNRQTSIVLPITFGIIYYFQFSKSIRSLLIASMPILINIIGLVAFQHIALTDHNLPVNYQLQLPHIVQSVLHPNLLAAKTFCYYFTCSTVMLGLFILPLTLTNLTQHFNQVFSSFWLTLISIAYLFLVITKIIFSANVFPYAGNMFYPFGVGPIIMTGFNTQDLHAFSLASKTFWGALNILGGFSFYAASISIVCAKNKVASPILIFFIIIFIIYLMPLCLSYTNDRYLLFLIPFFFIAYILSFDFQFNKLWLGATFTFMLLFSTATTHDYLNINRTRWSATDKLISVKHISPKNIDGGFEFNGWYSDGFKNYNPLHQGRWWWIEDDTYIISPEPMKGYAVEDSIHFSSFISFRFNTLYVLKRN